MSKFDDRIKVLNTAREAELAVAWFAENGSHVMITALPSGSATNTGKAAHGYLQRAAETLEGQIKATAKAMAEGDIKRGEEVL